MGLATEADLKAIDARVFDEVEDSVKCVPHTVPYSIVYRSAVPLHCSLPLALAVRVARDASCARATCRHSTPLPSP